MKLNAQLMKIFPPISTNVMRYTVLPEAFRPLTYTDSYDCGETEILSVRMNDFVSLVSLV